MFSIWCKTTERQNNPTNPNPRTHKTDGNHNNERKPGGLGPQDRLPTTGRRPWTSWRSANPAQTEPGRLKHPKPSQTTTNNKPNKPNPKPRQTNPKQRTNTPHSPQIAEALYAGASFGSAMPRIHRWTFSPCQDCSAYAEGPLLDRFLFSIWCKTTERQNNPTNPNPRTHKTIYSILSVIT